MSTREMSNRNWGFEHISVSALNAEIMRAIAKHGWQQTPLNPDMSENEKLIILVEEIGEVARAMTYDEGDPDKLTKELIQVAAMALAWAEARG